MRAHLAAVEARLEPLFPAHVVSVPPAPSFPYFIVWPSLWNPAVEQSVDAVLSDVDGIVGVTAVGLTPDSAAALLGRARDVLCPGGAPGSLTVAGRLVTLQWLGMARPLSVDRDITVGSTNTHPVSGADQYRLVSVPA